MVIWGCNNCGLTFKVDTEEDIPVGHLCSNKCVKEWAVKLDAAQASGVSVYSDPPQSGPPKFWEGK